MDPRRMRMPHHRGHIGKHWDKSEGRGRRGKCGHRGLWEEMEEAEEIRLVLASLNSFSELWSVGTVSSCLALALQ